MGVFSSLALLVRDATRLDRSQILPINALRNTVGVAVPLAGAATGHEEPAAPSVARGA